MLETVKLSPKTAVYGTLKGLGEGRKHDANIIKVGVSRVTMPALNTPFLLWV